MHKVFIGGYTDSAHSTILDGFNGIIGGKTRNEVTTFSVILMKSTYVKNLSVFVFCNKCFCLFFCTGAYWNKYRFIDLAHHGDSRINIVGNYATLIDKHGYNLRPPM